MTSDIVELDIPKFRTEFPQFSDALIYTDLYIETKWALATCYISDLNCGYLKGSCRQYAIFLMLAHLIALDDMIKNNVNPNFVTEDLDHGYIRLINADNDYKTDNADNADNANARP